MAADKTTANIKTSNGTYSVDITCYKIEHDYLKDLIILPVPKSEDAKNKSPVTNVKNPLVYNIDIQQLKQVITLTGYLLEEPTTGTTSLVKKDQLEAMQSVELKEFGGPLILTWAIGTTTITKYGNIIKCKVSEVPMLIGDEHPSTQRKAFPIILQFGVGQHRG